MVASLPAGRSLDPNLVIPNPGSRYSEIKPLRHASLEPNARAFFAPEKGHLVHGCQDFTMILKPFPRHLVDEQGHIVESRMIPHWLPMPPHPSTHQRRHLCPPVVELEPPTQEESAGDRWEALAFPPATGGADGAARPTLRVFILASKKRIHKRAVIRHRARTRLVAALRAAVTRLESSDFDVERKLDVRKHVLMLVANPDAYAKDMGALVAEMDSAVRRIASLCSRKHSTSSAATTSPRSKKFGSRKATA
ncbi:hypothetical protein PHBOTO_001396 [Pseudozyma hubeiensis]|nr:hypothetical protein PHBOTO_001396 [Pseudozyma hubeiensis]